MKTVSKRVRPAHPERHWWVWVGCLSALGAWWLVGCGATAQEDPGSETHWLRSCGQDGDCDTGRCECGICTNECSSNDDCAVPGAADGACVQVGKTELSCGVNVAETTALCAPSSSIRDTSATDATDDDVTDDDATDDDATDDSTTDDVTNDDSGDDVSDDDATDDSAADDDSSDDVSDGDATDDSAADDDSSDDESSDDDAAETLPELCDGSSDVRFLMTNAGGFVDIGYEFYGTYGHQFLAIDGSCHYYALESAGRAMREGDLSPEEAKQFAADLSYGTLGDYTGLRADVCDDGTVTSFWDPSGKTECGCICDAPEQPAAWRQAIAKVREWVPALYAAGQDYSGALQRVYRATTDEGPIPGDLPRWPLSGEPTDVLEVDDYDFLSAARLVEDEEDRRLLRELRVAWSAEGGATAISVVAPLLLINGIGVAVYEVYLKDVLPEVVDRRLEDVTGYPIPQPNPR